ncbi:MAG: sigma-E factor negative regulatory protein [Xanthomonadales bacterium]|nr:sigma-E factor negative regulatory protein [Xanthomonadales bacterium]
MNDQTNEQIRNQVSEYMDGELSRDSARFLARRLAGEAELRNDWMRWHYVRDCLRGHATRRLDDGLAARIAAAIADDAAPAVPLGARVLRWTGGFAVAASVALAALVLAPSALQSPGGDSASNAVASSQPARVGEVASSGLTESDLRPSLAPVTQTVSQSMSLPLGPVAQVDPRLNTWVLRHQGVQADPFGHGFVSLLPATQPPAAGTIVFETNAQPRR